MEPYSFRNDAYSERGNRHLLLVVIALVFSFIVHLFVMYTVSDWHFETVGLARQADPVAPARPPIHVERMELDPERALGNPETGDPEDGAGVGVPREQVRELARLPDPALVTPPARSTESLAGTLVHPQAPPRQPTALGWKPRQQIVAVVDRVVKDELATLPRRDIPRIERVARAPDYVPAVDVTRDRFGGQVDYLPPTAAVGSVAGSAESNEAMIAPREKVEAVEEAVQLDEAAAPESVINRFGEQPGEITDYFAVDNRLIARLETYAPEGARGRHYFRINIARRDASTLPVVPKDILLMQDSSRSLAEERLYFCRQALKTLLQKMKPGDRFNVVKFSGAAEFCFDDWARVQPDALAQAAAFIDTMRSEGETDIFASVRTLQTLKRDPARPLIAVVITDGRATTGLTESTRIIGEFTKLNSNTCSVFALGTHGRANSYLLDLLTFCNRGSSAIVTTGRWDIPDRIIQLVDGLANPVLGNVDVSVDLASGADLHPLPSANLFSDRPLEYYGSTPAGVTNLVMQLRGEGGEAKCDVIFQLDLLSAPAGGAAIQKAWARRKMHSLIGAYTRNPSEALLDEMRRISRAYDLPIPYLRQL